MLGRLMPQKLMGRLMPQKLMGRLMPQILIEDKAFACEQRRMCECVMERGIASMRITCIECVLYRMRSLCIRKHNACIECVLYRRGIASMRTTRVYAR